MCVIFVSSCRVSRRVFPSWLCPRVGASRRVSCQLFFLCLRVVLVVSSRRVLVSCGSFVSYPRVFMSCPSFSCRVLVCCPCVESFVFVSFPCAHWHVIASCRILVSSPRVVVFVSRPRVQSSCIWLGPACSHTNSD